MLGLIEVNKRTTLQWYIYEPIEKWFSTPLKKICSDQDARIYDRLSFPTRYCFKQIRYVEINCSIKQAIAAQSCVNRMIKECQYKLPWINDSTYHIEYNIHHAEKLKTIKDKLVAINSWNYLINKEMWSFEWFGRKNVMVYEFSPKLKGWQKDEVDLTFRFSVDDKTKETPYFISIPLRFHRVHSAPSPMFMSPLYALDGQYLQYLTLEDILSLELAYNDHRFTPMAHADIRRDIEKHLRTRLKFLYSTKFSILLNTFKIPEVLYYFIYKYHKQFNKWYVPNILSRFDRVHISNLFDIKVLNKQNYNITMKFLTPDRTEIMLVKYTTYGNRAKNFTVIEDNPFIQRVPYKFDCIIKDKESIREFPRLTAPLYNRNEFIEIYIKNGGEHINEVFKLVIDQFKHHDREQSKLVLDDIDYNQIGMQVFRTVLKTFNCVDFLNTKPTCMLLDRLKVNFDVMPTLNFKDCLLTNTDVVDLSLALQNCKQINIFGNNILDANVFIEIILAHFDTMKAPLDLLETWVINCSMFPNFCGFNDKLDWADAHLQCFCIDDHNIKYEIIKHGKMVDLYCELNGLDYEPSKPNYMISHKQNHIKPQRFCREGAVEDLIGLPKLTVSFFSSDDFIGILNGLERRFNLNYFTKLKEYFQDSYTPDESQPLKLLVDVNSVNQNHLTVDRLNIDHVRWRTIRFVNWFGFENKYTPVEYNFEFCYIEQSRKYYVKNLSTTNSKISDLSWLKKSFYWHTVSLKLQNHDELTLIDKIVKTLSYIERTSLDFDES